MLALSGLRKRFGATVALDGVDLDLAPGEVHALIGENGAGKSTLLNVIAGALAPDAGTMQVNGAPYAPASPLAARHAGVALIHQELSLCPHLTVAENVLMGLEPTRGGWLDRAAMRREAARLLESFSHPELAPDRVVGTLPIAARQVVEILRAMAAQGVDRADGRADQQPAARGRDAAVRADPAAQGERRDHRLHQPLPRGGARDRRSVHRAPRRPQRRGRHAHRRHQRGADRAHGRPPGRRAVPGARPGAAGGRARRRRGRGRRRRRSGAPRSGCAAARSSASPAWSARAAPRRSAR